MYTENMEIKLREGDGQKDEADRNRNTLGVGVEETLADVECDAHYRAEKERYHNLSHGLDDNRNNVHLTCVHSTCDSEGDRKDHEADCVVKSNDGKEHIGHGTLRLILLNYHKGCGRGGGRCDCTENDRRLNRKNVGNGEMQGNKCQIDN